MNDVEPTVAPGERGARRAPVQGDRPVRAAGTVPWATHLLAWEGYAAAGHGSQSAERVAERGGFGYRELQCALAGHYNRCAECREDHPVPAGWIALRATPSGDSRDIQS